jgi:hypothetical protein
VEDDSTTKTKLNAHFNSGSSMEEIVKKKKKKINKINNNSPKKSC